MISIEWIGRWTTVGLDDGGLAVVEGIVEAVVAGWVGAAVIGTRVVDVLVVDLLVVEVLVVDPGATA